MTNVGILMPLPKGGGIFQHALSIAYSLTKYSNKFNYKIIYYDNTPINWLKNQHSNEKDFIFLSSKRSSLIKKIKLLFNLILLNTPPKNETKPQLKNANIQLLVIPFPSLFGLHNNIPYIVAIPDLMHRYYPAFPEFPLKARITRDIIYKYASKYSILTIVDDNQGIEDLNKFFKISAENIHVIPYVPQPYIYEYRSMDLKTVEEILQKYNLPERFLFYPAQFWYHKNHINLIKALIFIRDKYNFKIPLVLVGYPKESYGKIMNFIKENSINNQFIHIGYVSNKEIVALYKKSVALVFPSLFGPTNIPPLEAIVLGTPVV